VQQIGFKSVLLLSVILLLAVATPSQGFAAGKTSWTKWENTYLFPVDNKFTADMNSIQSHLTNGACTPAEAKNVLVDALLWDAINNSPSSVVNAQVEVVARAATAFAADVTKICSPSWYPNSAQAASSRSAYNSTRSAINELAALISEYK